MLVQSAFKTRAVNLLALGECHRAWGLALRLSYRLIHVAAPCALHVFGISHDAMIDDGLVAQILKPGEKKGKYAIGGMQSSRPGTPGRNPAAKK